MVKDLLVVESELGIFDQNTAYETHCLPGDALPVLPSKVRLAGHDLVPQLQLFVIVERKLAREQCVGNDANRPDVALHAVGLIF